MGGEGVEENEMKGCVERGDKGGAERGSIRVTLNFHPPPERSAKQLSHTCTLLPCVASLNCLTQQPVVRG